MAGDHILVILSMHIDISAEDLGDLHATVQGSGQGDGSTVSVTVSLCRWIQG